MFSITFTNTTTTVSSKYTRYEDFGSRKNWTEDTFQGDSDVNDVQAVEVAKASYC